MMIKRVLAMLLVFVMVFSMMPMSAYAVEEGENPVTDIESEPTPEPAPVEFDFMEYVDSVVPVIFQSAEDIELADYLRAAYALPAELTFECEPAAVGYSQYADGETFTINLTATGNYTGSAAITGEVRFVNTQLSYWIANAYDVKCEIVEAGISKDFNGSGNVNGAMSEEYFYAFLEPNTTYNCKLNVTRESGLSYDIQMSKLNTYTYSDPYGVNHEGLGMPSYSLGTWSSYAETNYAFEFTTGQHYGRYPLKVCLTGGAYVDGVYAEDNPGRIITLYVVISGEAEAEESQTASVEAGSVTLDASAACKAYDKSIYNFSWAKAGDSAVLGIERTLAVEAVAGEQYICTISRKADTYTGCAGSDSWAYTVTVLEPPQSYAVTAKADDKSMKVGEAFPEFTCTATSVPELDNLEVIGISYEVQDANGNAVNASQLKVGEYSIVVKGAETAYAYNDEGNVLLDGAISALPGKLTVENGIIAADKCGDNLTWTLDGEGLLTISGTGDMYDYTYNEGAPWKLYLSRTPVKTIVIESGITYIGDYAFYYCQEVPAIVIPDTVKGIGEQVFTGCNALKTLTIPNSVTSIECAPTIVADFGGTVAEWIAAANPWLSQGGTARARCSDGSYNSSGVCGENVNWLLDLDGVLTISGTGAMSDYDSYYYSNHAPWYDYRNAITGIVIEKGITHIGSYAFYDCNNIVSVDIPEGVNSVGNCAFYSCDKLESIHFKGGTAPESMSIPSGIIAYFPVSNASWVNKIGDENCLWLLEGTESYAESLAKTINTFSSNTNESASLYIEEDVVIENDVVVPAKLNVEINGGITAEFKRNLTVNGGIGSHSYISGSGHAVLKAKNLAVNDELCLYYCDVNAETFKWSKDAWIKLYGGKLSVSGTVTPPSGTSLINVNADDYPGLEDAASENLWKYINYWDAKADSTEKLLEAMALPVGRLSLTVSGDIVLTEDLTIDSHEHIYISSAYVAGQDEPVGSITVNPGVKLVNNGEITLGGNLIVSDGAAFVNNDYIHLDGGLVIGSRAADISHSSNGYVSYYNEYTLPEAKYLQALIHCGLNSLGFGSDYTIDCDIELPANGWAHIYNGATVTIAPGARFTAKGSGRGRVTVQNGTLIINGNYDGPDIQVNVAEGGWVLPENRVVVTDDYGTIKYVNIKKIKASSIRLVDNMGNILGSGSVIPVDMYERPTYDLGVSVLPAEASALASWKSSSNSIAVVDDGGRVTFLKPGTVTITATTKDGSGKSASVKFTVSYKDFAAGAKFTTKLDATSESYGQSTGIGLQLGDSAMLSVFNGSTALDNSEFTFTSSNTAIATVDETGLVTAEKAGGSATITAALTGDPLGRTAKFTVKTIPAQLEKLAVLPYEGESGFVGVDANGNLCSESGLEPVSYALYVDKIAKGQPARTFRIMASGETAFGGTVEARGMITWSSSNSKLASVKENADGSVYITVKANVDGACTITATSKDASKTQGHIAVYIVEKSPRLGASSVTLDTQMLNLAELALVSSYGNSITGVEYYDAAYNKTGKVYEEKSGRIQLSYDAENGTLQLSAAEYLKNQTIKGQLLVHTEEGDYRLNLNVVIKNKAPSVSFKQTAKFNLFRLDSQAEIIPTVKGEEIEDLEFVGTDFVGEWDGEKIAVSYASNTPPAKPNAKATVKIWLKGYAFPVEKAVTVVTVTSKPSLSLVPASGTLNALYGEKDMSIAVYNKTAKADLDLSNVTASLSPASAGTVSIENGRLKFTAAEGYTGGKLSISLKDENWLSPVTLSLTLKVNTNGIVMKLKSSTLTVNRTFASAYSVDIVSSHSNLEQSRITGFAEPLAGSDKLSVWVEEGKVYARILDNSIENGSYTYNVTPVYDGGDFIYDGLPAVKLTVKVVNTQPKITLSKTSLSLNSNASAAGMETVLTELKAPAGYEIVSCSVSPVAGIVTQADGGRISVSLDTDALPAAGSYSLMVTPTVSDGECQATLNAIKLTVKVYSNAKLSASVSASGKIDAVQRSTSGISYTLTKLSNVVGNVVSAEPTGQHASMFELEELEPNAKGQFRVMLRLKDGVAVSTKASYKVQISYTLDTGIVVNTAVLTVKVSNTSLKLSAVPATQNIYQSQSRTRIVKYRVNLTSPVNAEIAKVSFGSVGLLQRSLVNEATNVWTEISEDGSYVDVYVRIKDTSALSAGKSYTLPLIIEAEGKAENIAATKLSLKLKVLK